MIQRLMPLQTFPMASGGRFLQEKSAPARYISRGEPHCLRFNLTSHANFVKLTRPRRSEQLDTFFLPSDLGDQQVNGIGLS